MLIADKFLEIVHKVIREMSAAIAEDGRWNTVFAEEFIEESDSCGVSGAIR